MKTITTRQLAAIKRVAQNVNFAITRRNKIMDQISKLENELEDIMREIKGHEAGIVELTGYTSENLITKVVEVTDKVDREGRPIKVTKYEPKEGVLVYNEDKKLYEIHIDEPVENCEENTTNIVEVSEGTF